MLFYHQKIKHYPCNGKHTGFFCLVCFVFKQALLMTLLWQDISSVLPSSPHIYLYVSWSKNVLCGTSHKECGSMCLSGSQIWIQCAPLHCLLQTSFMTVGRSGKPCTPTLYNSKMDTEWSCVYLPTASRIHKDDYLCWGLLEAGKNQIIKLHLY